MFPTSISDREKFRVYGNPLGPLIGAKSISNELNARRDQICQSVGGGGGLTGLTPGLPVIPPSGITPGLPVLPPGVVTPLLPVLPPGVVTPLLPVLPPGVVTPLTPLLPGGGGTGGGGTAGAAREAAAMAASLAAAVAAAGLVVVPSTSRKCTGSWPVYSERTLHRAVT